MTIELENKVKRENKKHSKPGKSEVGKKA